MTIFEYAREHPQLNQSFNMGMFSHTSFIMKKVLEVYQGFENLKEFIDVAGGIGTASDAIISKYPTIKCINLDLPHVIQSAPSRPGRILLLNILKAICTTYTFIQCVENFATLNCRYPTCGRRHVCEHSQRRGHFYEGGLHYILYSIRK